MTEQDQSVRGGLAIQAGGSVSITTGMSAAEMSEIMVGLAHQLALYQANAAKLVDERLNQFRKEILEEFARPGKANPEAFKDPDFQYLLSRAQHAYARSGDQQIGTTLVQMISERSNCQERSRLSLALNQAVETVAVLTKNEFAELSLSFLLTQTMNHGIINLDSFANYFTKNIVPLLADVSTEISSYSYLVAQGCASISAVGSFQIDEFFRKNYGGILCGGFTLEELKAQLGNSDENIQVVNPFLIPCLNDSSKLQLRAQNAEVAHEMFERAGISPEISSPAENLFGGKIWSGSTLREKIKSIAPAYENLVQLWEKTPLHRMTLTALGTVIGHANMHRVDPQFQADLAIWIK